MYESIIEKSRLFKQLKTELDALKARIFEYHNGRKTLNEDGFESVVKHTVRDTPQPKAISERFGVDAFDFWRFPDCFKRTEFDSVSVRRLIAEGCQPAKRRLTERHI